MRFKCRFPKIRGTFLGDPEHEDYSILMVMWEPPNFEKLPNIREDDVLGQEMEAKLASLRATLLHKTRQEYDY